MPEIRQDPTAEEWVIMARERAKRPHDFVRQQTKPELSPFSPSCPFCPGNETKTPPEILLYQGEKAQGWQVRAFANHFAALIPEGSTARKEEDGSLFWR